MTEDKNNKPVVVTEKFKGFIMPDNGVEPVKFCLYGPPGTPDDYTRSVPEYFNNLDQWQETLSVIDVFGYWGWYMNLHTDKELTAIFKTMNEIGLPLGLEIGVPQIGVPDYLNPGKYTDKTAEELIELYNSLDVNDGLVKGCVPWKRLIELGANIVEMQLDEPLTYALLDPSFNYLKTDEAKFNFALENTAQYIRFIRTVCPDVKIGDIGAFPFMNADLIIKWIDALEARLEELGVAGMDLFRLDVDWVGFRHYGYASDKAAWTEVKRIEDYCRSRGIEFGILYWASAFFRDDAPGDPLVNWDRVWYKQIMEQAAGYEAVGGRPDQFVVESWIKDYAPQIVPETEPWSYTRAALDFYYRFVEPEKENPLGPRNDENDDYVPNPALLDSVLTDGIKWVFNKESADFNAWISLWGTPGADMDSGNGYIKIPSWVPEYPVLGIMTFNEPLAIDSEDYDRMFIRLRNTTGDAALLHWLIMGTDGKWSDGIAFTVQSKKGAWQDVVLDLNRYADWAGIIEHLMLISNPGDHNPDGTIDIQAIGFLKSGNIHEPIDLDGIDGIKWAFESKSAAFDAWTSVWGKPGAEMDSEKNYMSVPSWVPEYPVWGIMTFPGEPLDIKAEDYDRLFLRVKNMTGSRATVHVLVMSPEDIQNDVWFHGDGISVDINPRNGEWQDIIVYLTPGTDWKGVISHLMLISNPGEHGPDGTIDIQAIALVKKEAMQFKDNDIVWKFTAGGEAFDFWLSGERVQIDFGEGYLTLDMLNGSASITSCYEGGNDRYEREPLNINAGDYDKLYMRVRIRSEANNNGNFYFFCLGPNDPWFGHFRNFNVSNKNGEWQDIVIDLNSYNYWTGVIDHLHLYIGGFNPPGFIDIETIALIAK